MSKILDRKCRRDNIVLSNRIMSLIIIGFLSVLIVAHTPEITALDPPPSDLNMGPYVDKIVYKVIEDEDMQWLALQAGEIEMNNGFIGPDHLPSFEEPDIDFFSAIRNGYGQITINCNHYPLNISGLRRAFAFAFDKTRVSSEITDGFSIEHDSVVPLCNSWCAEEVFAWHYYTGQPDIGNEILDDLGFEINETTGFRHAPNGEPFDILIEYASGPVYLTSIEFETPFNIAFGITEIAVSALHALHINAGMESLNHYEVGKIFSHDDYDMIFYSTNFDDYDVDWLAFDYWSEYADVEYQNPSGYASDIYDSWRDQLLYSTTYEEVYEAAIEMQKILHNDVPRLIVYENTYLQAYRNDRFTGHVEDLGRYISGPWTMRKIHRLDGTFGGSVPIAINANPATFNIYLANSTYSKPILENLYSSLYKRTPDLQPWPDLAESMLIETHTDNPSVPDEHTRFTIDIVQNATWSDGVPLTAEDVAFSINYEFQIMYEGPAGWNYADLIAVYAPTTYRVIIEFSTESYWHLSKFAYEYVIPEHIFNNEDGIGYENWESWDPVFNATDPHVTCGPFILTDFEEGEFYELSQNPLFHYRVDRSTPAPFNQIPTISSDGAISYELGSLGNEIVWTIVDDDPSTYSILMNGIERESGQCSSTNISHDIDGLTVGTYTFTLTVNDYSGNSESNSVRVSVVNPAGILPLNPLNIVSIAISSVSVVVILAATISIYKKKRILEPA